MIKTTKAPSAKGAFKCSQSKSFVNDNSATKLTKREAFPVPRLCLVAYLNQYRHHLLALPFDREISQVVDCCDVFLEVAERRGRG